MAEWNDDSLELVRAAAERGVCEAQAMYGQMLLDGKLVPINETLALHYFERAAVGGHLMAVNMVGRCLDQGWGVAKSPHLAAPWFRKAAEQGLDWGMYNLAMLLSLGSGVPKDLHESYHWLQKAADLGHAKSINILGGFYEDGWVVQKDRKIAREHYHAAAVGGDFRGQFNFARLLAEEGEISQALSWLRKVPETATPAFLRKMKAFFAEWPVPELQAFASALPPRDGHAALL